MWAILGLLCLLAMFAMMIAGVRAVRDEPDYSELDGEGNADE